MPTDLFASCPWAITPEGIEPLLRVLTDGTQAAPRECRTPIVKAVSAASEEEEWREWYSVDRGVAVISIFGVIRKASGSFLWFSWQGHDYIRAAYDAAMTDPSVRAVLLSFDSPGGVASGVKELADHIAASAVKPVYAYADGQCCSAAYWLASASSKVYAPVTASVGSIGVLYVHTDHSQANAAKGLRLTYITAGSNKALGNPDSPLSGEAAAYLQKHLASLHSIFRADVASRMPVDAENPDAWGDGQVFLAREALALGLLNGIVTDRSALIDLINKEMSMDLTTFAEAHPELLAQIRTEAAQAAEAQKAAELKEAVTATAESYLGLVHAVAGKEIADKVELLAKTDATPEQIAAFAEVFGSAQTAAGEVPPRVKASTDAAGEEGSVETVMPTRRDILAALRGATPGPVNTSGAMGTPDETLAAIDRISAL